ncbi:Trafficking protein particle complex subunit 4 [Perkinsus olseni]|uniref:Trafficking protein particle complex subunit 4 n=2 Tax=Perkinsus olseni TaxID=32597 RepID=A0A7J6NRR2_PEROL|nr:Trafficking protein particle complex subunit 4 [Perkinsus olseni]
MQLPATNDVAEEVASSEVSSSRAASESTTDSEVEGRTPAHRRIKDTPDSAVKYHSASTLRRCATKLPALLITLFLEFIPALVYSNGYSLLEPYIGEEKSNLFIALNSLVAAVAGNFALQNSSNMSRAISIGIITKDRWMGHAFKEFLLGCVLSVELGVLFFVITGFVISPILFHGEVDATLGGVLALVFIVSTTIGSFSGLITPPVLYFFLRLDPSACAGPGETCFQDVVGSVVMVYMAKGVFALGRGTINPRSVFAFYIVSRDGSLLYDYESLTAEQRPSANDKIRWSSTFHTLSAIAASLSPTLPASGHGSAGGGGSKLEYLNPRGIKTIRGDSYSVHCMTVISGTKGFAVCAPAFPESVAQELLAQIFIYFCDYVMKNPFYELGMPARCKQFDDRVQQLLGKYK